MVSLITRLNPCSLSFNQSGAAAGRAARGAGRRGQRRGGPRRERQGQPRIRGSAAPGPHGACMWRCHAPVRRLIEESCRETIAKRGGKGGWGFKTRFGA